MASHFVGLARGVDGGSASDFLTGVASNAAASVEVRTDDGVGLRPLELDAMIERIRQFYQNAAQVVAAGVVLNG